jgi:hypothetical protein
VLLVGAATFGGVLFNQLVAFLLGQSNAGSGFVLRVAVLESIYNAVLTPLVFPVVRRVAEASRPRKAARW